MFSKGGFAKNKGIKTTTLANLGSAQNAGNATSMLVDGLFNIKSNGKHWELQNAGMKSSRKSVSAVRLYGLGGKDTSAGRTAQLIMQAPAHYDAIRVNVLSAYSEGYAWKVTAAPSAKRDLLGPVDSSNTSITPTVVTFGSTSRNNPRNPNGGATTITSTGASGTQAANNLIQDRITSDIIGLKSLDRADYPSNNPLIYIRIQGQNIPIMSTNEMQSSNANSWAGSGAVPEFAGGYLTGDYSVTRPGSAWAEFGWPWVEVEFFLRGKQVINIGVTGDSTDKGEIISTSAVQDGGNISGYMSRFAKMLRDEGNPVGFSLFAVPGQHSFEIYNNALPAVMSGELTHLVIRPFSINDRADGTTISTVNDCLQRTSKLIATCKEYGVVPILLKPFAFGVNESVQQPAVWAYCDAYKASGGLVLDFRSLVNDTDYTLKSQYLQLNYSSAVVDQVHPNNICHADVANFIYQKCDWMFS